MSSGSAQLTINENSSRPPSVVSKSPALMTLTESRLTAIRLTAMRLTAMRLTAMRLTAMRLTAMRLTLTTSALLVDSLGATAHATRTDSAAISKQDTGRIDHPSSATQDLPPNITTQAHVA